MHIYTNRDVVRVGLLICGIAVAGMALADCPITMPPQLLKDCLVYESAGSGPSFPKSDYAQMDLYTDWLKEQQTTAKSQQEKIFSTEEK
jgi:hypothetical protein